LLFLLALSLLLQHKEQVYTSLCTINNATAIIVISHVCVCVCVYS